MLSKQSGMAYLEIIPLIVLLMLLLKYSFGFFGVIHTGILNTIAARNYAFETFRHRANLNYFRPRVDPSTHDYSGDQLHGTRYHSKVDESKASSSSSPSSWATVRSIGFPSTSILKPINDSNEIYHNAEIMNEPRLRQGKRYQKEESGSDPVWVRERYGICLSVSCGS